MPLRPAGKSGHPVPVVADAVLLVFPAVEGRMFYPSDTGNEDGHTDHRDATRQSDRM